MPKKMCLNKECKSKDYEYYSSYEIVGYGLGTCTCKCLDCGAETTELYETRVRGFKPYFHEGADRTFHSREEEQKYAKDNKLLTR